MTRPIDRHGVERPHPARVGALASLLLAGLACSTAGEPPVELPAGPAAIVVAGVGLDRPVSVVHDPVDDVYLVGNAAHSGAAFIARLAPSGRVRTLRWIDGADPGVRLRAPGGMAIRGDTLHVADGDCIRLFRRSTGEPAGAVCPPGAVSLNDAAVDARGRVYVSDATSGIVYVLDGAGAVEFARAESFTQSGGLAAGARGVFVAGAGLHQLTPAGPRVVIRDGGKPLGGIVFTRDGSFAFSNRSDATVLYVQARAQGTVGAVWTLARDVPSPGYLGYDGRRDRILIPHVEQHRLDFVSLRRAERVPPAP